MKSIIVNYKYLLVAVATFFLVSCDSILDVNEDPNNPSIDQATPEVLFPAAVMSSAGMIGGQLTIVGGIWSQYWAQSAFSNQYKEIDSYNLTRINEEVNLPYEELMAGALADYHLAIQKARERQDWRYNLMAVVMKAYTYQVLVDLFDQVPFSESFQGAGNLQPKFEDGYTIYKALLAEIDDALSQDYKSHPLDASQQSTDFIFHGNMNKWEQFANTLKLKMYLRMVNAKPAEAEAGIRALYQTGGNFLAESAGVTAFVNQPDRSNPFYEYNIRRLNTTTNIRASMTFASWLILNNDPRSLSYFGTMSPIGIHQGDFNATQQQQPSYNNATVFRQAATDPVWFISLAESNFMQAEALERYFGGAGAKGKYDAGVTAAFAQFGLSPGNFITTGPYVYPTGNFEQKLEAIIVQKWASFPGSHALEAFFEQNRTGYPKISPVYSAIPGGGTGLNEDYIPGQWVYAKNGFTQGRFPKRFVFPDYEQTRNVNTPAEVPITTNVWWAK
ncbi:SusD/RagB family nutrient-binding outer membrane lipoprotein [Solitalea lacus]|uniref:SusD/RagB family nutrient-binding outer membrane lipoprotein n=1 Tax=Solitalea lacus TaxID=2911172 RepID=UPI001EDA0CED|nr:SusD/RagB family nutrient-binding outer membrane lipoprotein [Solitalea lacus]UKJ07688.1 SusD/RagB family nutrient-binding outer membrane lipoprotein [Solitalea lacus]